MVSKFFEEERPDLTRPRRARTEIFTSDFVPKQTNDDPLITSHLKRKKSVFTPLLVILEAFVP